MYVPAAYSLHASAVVKGLFKCVPNVVFWPPVHVPDRDEEKKPRRAGPVCFTFKGVSDILE